MREEIRLGNEALAGNDIETAERYFQQLLADGGTPTQQRIAENRLREIHAKQEALRNPPPAKPRARRKATGGKAAAKADGHTFVRLPEKSVVVIKKY